MITTERWAEFGRWVEQERIARRLSKTEATKRSGISPSSWYNIEHGGRIKDGRRVAHQPTTETLLGIAAALEMDPAGVFAAAGLPSPLRAPSWPPEAADSPQGPSQDAGLLSLLAQLLAEQRELRVTLAALREEVVLLRREPARR